MRREFAASALVLVPGCSLLLDFSDGAIPVDAAADAPFSEALCGYGEPNDTPATATLVRASDTGPAAICPAAPADHDFYRLTVPTGTAIVTIAIQLLSATGDLDLALYDASGARPLAASHGFGDTERIACPSATCAALAPGDYLFEVLPGVDGAVNDYRFSVALSPARIGAARR